MNNPISQDPQRPLRHKVIIVDDMKINLLMYEKFFLNLNYEIHLFSNPLEVLDKAKTIIPDLFLLDIEMPNMDGIELCQKIKKVDYLKDIPVIFITTLDNEESMTRAFNAGAVDFINKPFKPVELKLRLASTLKSYDYFKTIQIQNRKLYNQAEDNNSLVRILSHDLKNSLNVIQAYAKKIQHEKILSSSLNMIEMIHHVEEIIALEGNKKEIVVYPVDVVEVIKKAIELFSEKIIEKKVDILFLNKTQEEQVLIKAEKTGLLNQVLANLISNALKFSFENSKITIILEKGWNMAWVKISDTGIGIPQNMIGDLFNKYKKTTRPGTKQEKGTGFGLPLVKTYVELFGGNIEVNSTEKTDISTDHGTTFVLTFNMA